MLYRFIFENYKSFKGRNEISLIPESTNRHAAYMDTPIPVLRDAVIYGANASGKSNVVKAISFMKRLVVTNNLSIIVPKLAFRMSEDTKRNPSLFVAEMRIGDKLYQYGIALSFLRGIVLNEWLKEYSAEAEQWNDLIMRVWDEDTQKYEVSLSFPENSENASRYNTYAQDLASSTKVLALSVLAEKELQSDVYVDSIQNVYKWFEELIIIFPHTRYNLLGKVVKDIDAVNELYKKYFKIFGIDIDEIKLSKVPSNYIRLDEDIKEEIRKDLLKDDDGAMAMIHGEDQDYLVELSEEKTLQFSEVRFVHRQGKYETDFSLDEESDGTQRLFDLIPMLGYVAESDKVVVIDEIDRSLHCLLTQEMFKNFIESTENRHSQLVCTTHQVLLMDLDLLGRREIWFVEKKAKESKLYSLDQYKFDGDTLDVARNYLLGRFGGIPKY